MWDKIPYTNVHELNLDWIISRIKELEKIQAQTIAPTDTLVNIADVIEGDLTNDNIVDAIRTALQVSSYIFIPNGKYTFNITLNQDCHIVMDSETVIQSDNASPCIDIHDSRFSIYGGAIESGLNDDSRTLYGDHMSAIIKCTDCHDIHIEGVKSTHSKHGSVLNFEGCEEVLVQNCSFSNFLMTAIWVLNYNRNVRVNNCSFMYAKRPTGHEYCYFVCTGVSSFVQRLTPVDGYIVENCYGYDSEDCGIDTHGAKNVVFRNNTILEAICSLTAYNDNARALRPADWTMENILIENNYCVSSKDNEVGRQYPHPFVFIGASNHYTDSDAGYEDNQGSYYAFCNCVVRNNYFSSANTFTNAQMFLDAVSRNVTIENNVFDCRGVNRPIQPVRAINIRVLNNTIISASATSAFSSSLGECRGNIGGRFYTASSAWSCIDGISNDVLEVAGNSNLIRWGQMVSDTGGTHLCVCTSNGIRPRPDLTLPASVTITVANGIATLDHHDYIPGLALKLTDGGGTTVNAYVRDVLTMKTFKVTKGVVSQPVPDGTYSCELRAGTISQL